MGLHKTLYLTNNLLVSMFLIAKLTFSKVNVYIPFPAGTKVLVFIGLVIVGHRKNINLKESYESKC